MAMPFEEEFQLAKRSGKVGDLFWRRAWHTYKAPEFMFMEQERAEECCILLRWIAFENSPTLKSSLSSFVEIFWSELDDEDDAENKETLQRDAEQNSMLLVRVLERKVCRIAFAPYGPSARDQHPKDEDLITGRVLVLACLALHSQGVELDDAGHHALFAGMKRAFATTKVSLSVTNTVVEKVGIRCLSLSCCGILGRLNKRTRSAFWDEFQTFE